MQKTGRGKFGSLLAGASLLLIVATLSAALVHGRPTSQKSVKKMVQIVTAKPAAVSSIELPPDMPLVPAGPNQEQFTAVCRLCHSPKLVLTQPRFPEKKWTEVVHKMVAVYGAKMLPEEEKAVVTYLMSVRGAN